MKKIVMLIFFIVLAFNCTYAQHLPPEGEALEVAKDLINPANDNVFVSNPLPIGDHTFVSTERDDSHRCAYRLKNSTGCGYARGYGTPTCNDGGNSNWMPFYNCLDVFMKISGVTIAGTSIMKLSFNTATVTKFFSPSTAGGGYVHDFPAMGKYSMSSLNSYRSKLLLLSDLKVGDRITVNRDYITAAQQFVLDCSDQCSIMPNGNFISWNKEQVCQDRDYMKLTQYSTSTENIGITYSATGASSVTTANASADFFVTQEMINAIAANNGYLELSVYRPSANFMGDPIGSLRSTFRVKFVVDYAFESMQVSAIDYYDTRLTDFTAIEPTDYTWDIEDCNTAGFIINLHPDFKGCIQSTSSNVQAAIYDAFGEEKPSTLSITSTGVNVKLSSTGKFSPDDYIEVKVSFPNTKVTQTYYFRIDISTLQNNVSLVSLASKPLCEGHDSYYFSRSGANPDYDFAIQPPAEMYSSSEGIYKIPVSAKNIVFSTSFRRCALIIYSPIPAAIQLVKPQLTAQNFYCDDNTDFSGNNIQISNATLFNTPDFPQNYSPFTALIKEISGSNATTERNIPFFSNSTLIRASNSATEKIQLKVQAVANNGCTSVSDEVEFAKRISPQRPVVAGRLIYCGTDSNTYLVHNNPEYYTQYWLYDVTGGDERFLRHKGANFWIFRPDQHDPKEEAPTEVNGEAYYDMRLSAGSYEIRATHDLNSCVTVLPFTVANFNTNLFEMVAKGSMVKVCNSSMEGVDILNLFEDCEMKTILQSAQAATYNCAWTVKKEDKFLGAVSGAALRASVHNAEAGVYAVELTVTNADGCAKTFTSSLTVEARPAAFTIAADNSHVCNDAQVSISAGNASVADLTYAWKLNDQLTGETQSSISPGLLPGASYLTATVTNAAGCSSTSNRLEVNRYIFSPDVRFTSNEFSYCASDAAVNLLDLLEGSDKSRVLQKQDGISYTLTASASGLYFDETTVEPYDVDLSRSTAREYVLTLAMVQNGCEVRKEAKLTIKAVPASFAIASDKALSCDNDLVTITANGADGLSYRWYINGNQVPDQSSKSLETSLPDGTNIVYAVAVNNNGCSVSSAPVTVSAWEVKTNVSMAVAPLSECEVENGEIDLYTYLSGDAADLALIKDPNNSKGLKFRYEGMQVGYNATAYHIASFANNPARQDGSPYALKFTIWQENVPGCVHTYERNVKVLPRPAAFTLTANAAVACNEDLAFITASNGSTSGLTYCWTVNSVVKEGMTSASLPKSALNDGVNTVGVTAVNAAGCATASSNQVSIKLTGFNPAVRFKEALAYCQNSDIFTLDDVIEGNDAAQLLNGTGGYTYSVTSTPAGLFTQNALGAYSVTPAQKAAGDYLITLSMNNGECEVYRTASLTILPIPEAFTVAASTPNVVCNSDPITVTASNSSVSGLTYKWYVNNTQVNGVTGPGLAKNYLVQNDNEVYTMATNGSSCSVRSSNTVAVTLHTLAPAVEFTASSYAYCQNADKFSLHGLLAGADRSKVLNSQEGMTYEITSSPTGLTVSGNTYEVNPAQSTPQTYTVTLRVQRNGCEVSRTATLTILPIPATFTVTASTPNVVCNSDPITVTASNSGVSGLTYKWYVNNALISGVTGPGLAKNYLAQNGNEVYTTATNGSGCSVRSSNTVAVTLHTLAPAVEFTAPSYAYCANADKFSLHGLLTGGDKSKVLNSQESMTYEIASSPAGLNIDNAFGDYRVDPAQSTPQTYTVTLRVRRSGCEVSKTTTLTILPIPAGFNVTTTKPSTMLDGQTVYLLCNSSSFDAATTALTNTASVEWYLGANKIATTAQGSYNYAIGSDQRAQVSAVAVSSKGCTTTSNNVLNVDRRTVDFSGISVNVAPTAYCNGDENVNYFTFVTAANKSDIEGSSNGWGYSLDAGGISQCAGESNPKMLCLQNSTPGTYNTLFTVTKNSCSSSWSKAITIKPVPGATTLTPEVSNLCENGSATLTATTQNYVNTYTYNWYKGSELVRSGYTARTHSYTAESGVTQTTWKVAAVDNSCTGAVSNEVTVNNNQPTMDAAFVKGTFTSDEGVEIKFSNMVNVDMASVNFIVTRTDNGATITPTWTSSNNVYKVKFNSGVGTRRCSIEISFKDEKGGVCSNSILVGEVDRSTSVYTVVSGDIASAQQSEVVQLGGTPAVAAMLKAGMENYDDEAERLYREYVSGLRNDEHKAFLAPTYTSGAEDVKLLIYANQPEQVVVKVYSSAGSLVTTRQFPLYAGITEHRLSAQEKPQVAGMYYVVVEYVNGIRETLKGVVK